MKKDHLRSAAYVVLRKDDALLMLRRFNTGYEDGNYSLVAGHVEIDEAPLAAIIREAKEEAGILIQKEHIIFKHVLHRNCIDTRVYVDYFFECHHWQGEPAIMEPEKCSALTWFSLTQLPPNVIPYIKTTLERIYIQNLAFSEIGYEGEQL